MSDKTELRMNLAAVKRVDPYAKDIVDSSAHVAFYTFNSDDNEWEKTDVEGVFFIYSRNAEPLHSIFINNRLNTNSFIEPITGQLELQSQPPFLLYRNERSRIRGFWFYNSSECDRIGELVGRLIKECETAKMSNVTSTTTTTTNATKNHEMRTPSNNVDIFSMLSKAQEDFNNSQNQSNRLPTSTTTVTTATTTIVNQQQPDVTSQSVMNFFAAAKPAAASEVPLFQRLMSKPVPVDQIEKQQRASTPQDGGRMSPPSSSSTILHHNLANLVHQQHPVLCSNSVGSIESAINLMNINSPKQQQQHNNQDLGTSPLARFLGTSTMSAVGSGGQPRTLSASEVENSQKPLHQLLRKESAGVNTIVQQTSGQPVTSAGTLSSKPALMPPTMFLSSSTSLNSSSSITTTKTPTSSSIKESAMQQVKATNNCIQRQQSIVTDGGGGGGTAAGTAVNLSRPEPLTQTQLIQAMMYMMQNDPEFVKKLHEAYLKSFTEMVSL